MLTVELRLQLLAPMRALLPLHAQLLPLLLPALQLRHALQHVLLRAQRLLALLPVPLLAPVCKRTKCSMLA